MTRWHVDLLGDAAVSVRVDGEPPMAANAQVHRLAEALRGARLPGVRDLVPGMRELVVHVDPLRCEIRAVEEIARATMATGASGSDAPSPLAVMTGTPLVEIPVTYGGEGGPDLAAVAEATGLSEAEVCRRHAATAYVVCFNGFLPGFPYLGLLDPSLRLPRRATPRARVPAGSVAIAGEYTGIYPAPSPGGWHLIGRTEVTLFDVAADPPARLGPGTRVRFVARPGA